MSSAQPKRYTFEQVAKRECAECTTTITTTVVNRYIDAADFDAYKQATDALLSPVEVILTECKNQCEAAILLYETEGDLLVGDVKAKLAKAEGMRDRIDAALAAIRKHRGETNAK